MRAVHLLAAAALAGTGPGCAAAGGASGAAPDAGPGAPTDGGAAVDAASGPGPGSDWAIGLGGVGDDPGTDLALAPDGAVYVIFFFTGSLDVAGRHLTTSCDIASAVARIERDGALGWVRPVAGDDCAHANAVAAVGIDGVAIAGVVLGATELGGTPAVADGWPFLLRLDAGGEPRWSSLGRASETIVPRRVVAGADGRIAVVGHYSQSLDLGAGALPVAPTHHAYAALYGAGGDLLWSRAFGGELQAYLSDAVFTPGGELIAAGAFRGELPLGITTLAQEGPVDPPAYDGFLARLAAADGAPQWAWQLPGAAGMSRLALGPDAIFLAGTADRDVDLGGGSLRFDGYGTFVARYDLDGVHQWSTRTSQHPAGVGSVSLALGRQLVLGGAFVGPGRIGDDEATADGQNDGFVVALDPADGDISWSELVTGPAVDWVVAVAADDDAWLAAGAFSAHASIAGHGLDSLGATDAFVVRRRWPAVGDPTVP